MTKDIAIKLRWTAGALAGLMLVIYFVSYPPTYDAYISQRDAERAQTNTGGVRYGIDTSDEIGRARGHGEYSQCLMTDNFDGYPCPIGGNLYWLLWLSVAGVAASFVLVKRSE